MDPNSLQHLPGMAYVQKLEQAALSQTPFAEFDVLTPDEPIWAWQIGKHVLHILQNKLVSQGEEMGYEQDISVNRPLAE